jgi:hypothetical protein
MVSFPSNLKLLKATMMEGYVYKQSTKLLVGKQKRYL